MDLKILKIKKKFKKSEHEPDPDFYWKLILTGTFILIALAATFGVLLFFKTNSEEALDTVPYSEQGKKISKDRLDAVMKYYSDREVKSQTIIKSPAPVIDPSR